MVEERVNNMHQEITAVDFSNKTWKDDLTLTVEGKQIYVCKQVLALVSPVFDAMFVGDFKERNPEELKLPGKKHADFCEFLRCIYPNMLERITLSNAHSVLPLADEYQVTRLKAECETCLLKSLSANTSAEELYALLQEAYLYNLETLKAEAIALLVDIPQEDLDEAGAKVTLPPDVEMDLQRRMIRILKTSSGQMNEEMKTLAALNGCIAATTQENQILSEYQKGKWKGASAKFEVNLKGNPQEETEIHVSKVKFTLQFYKPFSYYNHVSLKSASNLTYDVRVMGMIIVKKWMVEKSHKVVFFTGRVRTSSSNINKEVGKAGDLENETNGFIYDGKIKGEIHILVLDE